jgi:nicotinamidase/pyrazinamidase
MTKPDTPADRGTLGLPDVGPGDALLAVDVQNDFLPGGALGVRRGDEVLAPLSAWTRAFVRAGLPVYVSRDWHPPDHCSFAARGGPWPPHCVAGTPGAAFAAEFTLPPEYVAVSKATHPQRDAYSAFDGTALAERLRSAGVRRLYVGGLATDYCVRATVLDARAAGLEVVVLRDAIRAVDVAPGDGDRAIAEMRAAGASFVDGWPDAPLPTARAPA